MALWLTTSWSFFLQPNIFINEIHYFNNSTGQAEFVELAYESGQDVSQVYLQLYIGTDGQGATGQMYGERLFVGTDGIPGSVGAFGGLSFVYFDIDGLRNSASGDGMALVDGRSGVVIEFISYDGQFVATQGPANGMESVDIGVSELIDGEVGLSLQLGGVGCVGSSFVWQTVQTATKGVLNYGQAGTCASNAFPTSAPTPSPTPELTQFPTPGPSPNPSPAPTRFPTGAPIPSLTPAPTPLPTPAPTPDPTPAPTPLPTGAPTTELTPTPTPLPTPAPTPNPSSAPTPLPTRNPTPAPTPFPSSAPTPSPTPEPTQFPTLAPTPDPTPAPTPLPTPAPTPNLTPSPSPAPTPSPSPFPSPLPVTPSPIFAPGHDAQWVQVGNDIDGETPGDRSGISVALSSNSTVLAIGAYLNDGGGSRAGHVRVYFNAGGGWEQRGSDLDGSAAGDGLGWSVSLSADGTILAAGAVLGDGVNGVNSGQVHLFQWISNTWQPLGSTLDGAGAGDQFGYSVALSDNGTILAVGAVRNDAGGSDAGHVRVFAWTGTDWTQRGNDVLGSSPGDRFGNSVALSSDGSIVSCGGNQPGGNPPNGNQPNDDPGYVRIYSWSGSAWQQQGSTLMGFSSNDYFGESVSLSGDGSIIAVGADNGNYVVVFRNDGSDWVQIGQTIRGESSNDWFGISVSLSFDGKTILIGGYLNDSNGFESGHALVFRLSPNEQEWMQVGQELVGEAALDLFGWSTSISNSGTRISIGAWGNDGNGDEAGHVRVYDLQ